MKLITRLSWNPVGESLWSILSKLILLNRLSNGEISRFFSTSEKPQNAWASQKSDNLTSLDGFYLANIQKLTGIPETTLNLAIPSAYVPAGAPIDSNIFSDRLRICEHCFSSGVHLAIHQIKDSELCLLHDHELTDTCSNCGTQLPYYYMSSMCKSLFTCPHCKFTWWSGVRNRWCRDLAKKRVAFVRQYLTWMDDVCKRTKHSRKSKLIWLGKQNGPECYRDLAVASKHYRLGDGLERALPSVGRIYKLPVDLGNERFTGHNELYDVPQNIFQNHLYSDLIRHSKKKIQQISRYIRYTYLRNHLGIGTINPDGVDRGILHAVRPLVGEGKSCWRAGYWLWKRLWDDFFPDDIQLTRFRWSTDYKERYACAWNRWRAGPGSLIFSSCPSNSSWLRAHDAIIKIIDVWMWTTALHDFVYCVGLTCRMVGQPIGEENIHDEFSVLGGGLDFFIDQRTSNTQLKVVTRVFSAELRLLKELAQTNYQSTGLDYSTNDFSNMKSIIKILNLSHTETQGWADDLVAQNTTRSRL